MESIEDASKRILGYVPENLDETTPRHRALQDIKTRAQYNYSDMRYTGGSLADMPIRSPLNLVKRATSESIETMSTYTKKDSHANEYSFVPLYKSRSSKDVMEQLKKSDQF